MNPTYDFADLERLIRASRPYEMDDDEIRTALGCARTRLWNLRRRQPLSSLIADELATTAGYHPSLVWPTWFTDAAHERFCDCGEPLRFGPGYLQAQFCRSCKRTRDNAREQARRAALRRKVA